MKNETLPDYPESPTFRPFNFEEPFPSLLTSPLPIKPLSTEALVNWVSSDLLRRTPESKKHTPPEPLILATAWVTTASQPLIKGVTGYFKANLVSPFVLLNILLVGCRSLSGLATYGAGTYEAMTEPTEDSKREKSAEERIKRYVEEKIKPHIQKIEQEEKAKATQEEHSPPILELTEEALAELATSLEERP